MLVQLKLVKCLDFQFKNKMGTLEIHACYLIQILILVLEDVPI